ncbi:MAG TPA: radical SAM protein, partial [Chitinispirillaceae bacterium]|nr:radical SAM protein [Chitinispirillaceae bacterium]
FRSPENIISEVEYVHKNLGINEIFFQDDTMNLNRNWFYKVCDLIIERGLDKLSYKAPFRVNAKLVDEELLAKAKRAGFWIIFYGVESGNQEILDKVKKGTTIEEIKRAFRLTQDAGIRTIAAFMVGNFGENHSSINDSIALAKELRPDSWGFSIATPLPGTEFHDIAR